jgi:hypothetical protein
VCNENKIPQKIITKNIFFIKEININFYKNNYNTSTLDSKEEFAIIA